MMEIFSKLRVAQRAMQEGLIQPEDIVMKSHPFSLCCEECFALAKYLLDTSEVRSWTGKLVLHTGMKRTVQPEFVFSTAFDKLLGTIDAVEMRKVLSSGELLGLAKFFLGTPEEIVIDSKIVLRTSFKRKKCGAVEVVE